jgi:UDP-N-acetyl-D-mannosaminuronic acid transferase (WecB/TagA/CpsF family)
VTRFLWLYRLLVDTDRVIRFYQLKSSSVQAVAFHRSPRLISITAASGVGAPA